MKEDWCLAAKDHPRTQHVYEWGWSLRPNSWKELSPTKMHEMVENFVFLHDWYSCCKQLYPIPASPCLTSRAGRSKAAKEILHHRVPRRARDAACQHRGIWTASSLQFFSKKPRGLWDCPHSSVLRSKEKKSIFKMADGHVFVSSAVFWKNSAEFALFYIQFTETSSLTRLRTSCSYQTTKIRNYCEQSRMSNLDKS